MKNLIPYGRQYVDNSDVNSVIKALKKDLYKESLDSTGSKFLGPK